MGFRRLARIRTAFTATRCRPLRGYERIADRASRHIFNGFSGTLGFPAGFTHLVMLALIQHFLAALQVLKALPDDEYNRAEQQYLGE